jgi:hypothetical protein
MAHEARLLETKYNPPMDQSYTDPAVATFVAIPVLLVVALVWGTAMAWRRSGGAPAAAAQASCLVGGAALAWMTATWAAAQTGILRQWNSTPPPFGLLIVAVVAVATVIAFSGLGRHLAVSLPLWALVAVQAFRLPLELAMHALYERGIVPSQMTYTGRNFDIVTGATAIIVAAAIFAGVGGRRLAMLWNVSGLVLLVNIVMVAVLSTPTVRYFGDDHLNVWVAYPPFVWLPAVMVLAALAGHLLIFRALRLTKS